MAKTNRYYAYVALDMVETFEDELYKREDKIRLIERGILSYSNEGTPFYPYIIEAEDGVINPKWKLPDNEEES